MNDLDLGATLKGFSSGQKVFGRYTLKKILGRGGMGVVWLARDEKLEREVALKFLPEVVKSDRAAMEDLKRETRRALDLTHTHIVRIYDFVEDATTAAIAMEYISGDTLSNRRLDQPAKVFEPGELRRWVKQVCEALAYAHEKARIVHRDLKPANLMLDAHGDLKIADFGISRSISDSVSRVSAQAGSSGTPAYMSPQQMMGEKPEVADDVYALGATLYELLTGKPPFFSGNLIAQVQSKVPASIAERRLELEVAGAPVPPEWAAAIAACLAKEPAQRPASAREVAQQLGLVVTMDTAAPFAPVLTRPPLKSTAPAMAPAPATRQARPVWLYPVIIAALLTIGAGYYFGFYAPAQARQATEQARQAQEQAKIAEATRVEQQKKSAAEAAERKKQEEIAARLAAARGGFVIRTEPAGAEVRVGAVMLDKSPLSAKDLKLGKYPVRVRLAGYEDYDGEIEVKENEYADSGLIRLERSTGMVRLSSVPAGVEYSFTPLPRETDEGDQASRPEGRTPVEAMKVPTGKYKITFVRQGWGSSKKTVTVSRGGEEKISADLRGGSIDVQSDPAGATVRLQGKVAGTTPLVLPDVPWGAPAQVTVELPTYAPIKQELSPQPGQNIPLRLKLQRLHTRIKLTGLPAGLRGSIQAQWEGRNIPLAGDSTVELPVDGGTGRLSVSYGPTVWEKDLTLAAGETIEVKPDFVLRFDISKAPRVTRLRLDSTISGGVSMNVTETQEITWKRQENGRWLECETAITATTNSFKLLGNELYVPGTRYRFQRSGAEWNVDTVYGGLKAMKNFKPPYPYSAATWLTDGVLPKVPVLPGDSWDVPVTELLSTAFTGMKSPSGQIRGRLVSLQMENGQQVAVISFEGNLRGQAMMLNASQSILGTTEVKVVLGAGWVKSVRSHMSVSTTGVANTVSDTTITEEPMQ